MRNKIKVEEKVWVDGIIKVKQKKNKCFLIKKSILLTLIFSQDSRVAQNSLVLSVG